MNPNRSSPGIGLIAMLALLAACAAPARLPGSVPPATPTPAVEVQIGEKVGTPASAPQPSVSAVIDKYRQEIPRLIAEQGIPGLAVAVADEHGLVWSQGFGYTDVDKVTPVTADTPFSLQSTSKMLTADAIMLAVQDGLLDLDEPITAYLPDFTINSIFEENPERKLTLRILLSHTAGFTHDAPVGNNFDLDHWQFEPHVKSISQTWLRMPVGSGYAYSNMGIDLAAYILQVKARVPFEQYVQEHLFGPLGMSNSTFDPVRIQQMTGRAIGHTKGFTDIPVEVPMQAAGGLYSTANDLAKFVQFQLSRGKAGGKQLLQASLLDQTYVPRNPVGAVTGYGLGMQVGRCDGIPDLGHGGAGFGFLSDVFWLPDVGLGAVVLTNSEDHDLHARLVFQILADMARYPSGPYRARADAMPALAGKDGCEPGGFCPPADLAQRIAALARPVTDADRARWQGYVGNYQGQRWGLTFDAGSIRVEDGELVVMGAGSSSRTHVTEVETGLFFTDDGEALDLRGTVPTFAGQALSRKP